MSGFLRNTTFPVTVDQSTEENTVCISDLGEMIL